MTPAPYWHSGGSIIHRFGGAKGLQTEHLTDAQAKERFVWYATTAIEFDANGDHDAARYCAKQASAIHDARLKAEAHRKASAPYVPALRLVEREEA